MQYSPKFTPQHFMLLPIIYVLSHQNYRTISIVLMINSRQIILKENVSSPETYFKLQIRHSLYILHGFYMKHKNQSISTEYIICYLFFLILFF